MLPFSDPTVFPLNLQTNSSGGNEKKFPCHGLRHTIHSSYAEAKYVWV